MNGSTLMMPEHSDEYPLEARMRHEGEPARTERPSDHELLTAYRNGDQRAASLLFERYYHRLRRLVKSRMGRKLRAVEESSDVVQSALRSVFMRPTNSVAPDDTLWPLLVTVTLRKMYNRGRYYGRECRDQDRNVPMEEYDPLAAGPSPDDAMQLEETLAMVINAFPASQQKIIEHLLQGLTIGEIAKQVDRTNRTVYRVRNELIALLERLLDLS